MSTDTIEGVDLSQLPVTSIPDSADAPADIACVVCGKDISGSYGGRGRKPKYCDEHKPTRGAATNIGTRGASTDVKTAVQSLENLYQMLGMGLALVGAYESASALTASIPQLSVQNAQYLATDKALTKSINKVGTVGGRTGFFVANAMVLVPVAIGAYNELSAKMDRRAAEREDAAQDG